MYAHSATATAALRKKINAFFHSTSCTFRLIWPDTNIKNIYRHAYTTIAWCASFLNNMHVTHPPPHKEKYFYFILHTLTFNIDTKILHWRFSTITLVFILYTHTHTTLWNMYPTHIIFYTLFNGGKKQEGKS